jgi:hypothetical protein
MIKIEFYNRVVAKHNPPYTQRKVYSDSAMIAYLKRQREIKVTLDWIFWCSHIVCITYITKPGPITKHSSPKGISQLV